MLPWEDVALFSRGKKLTSDIARRVQYNKGMHKAKEFLVTQQKWTEEQFNEVNWDWPIATMTNKEDMYKV